ncbi:MAG TPA: ACP phosphodiesterase [Thermoflexales bacterium]|nr:ACP phosphodiesterase [Thermoflexales bacterium]HQW37035.1 ACP phosphodiesterase [Thermoflexales bacterium]HQZ22072.1 ACP phosphodiesterase [Thermoflexales bacterium]HQZ99988.1 ACP phosphodiesterase [Thermoflexales bacterium]
MNWLAHLYLVGADDEERIGSVIADWVKGEARLALSAGIRRGIAHHQQVDVFTDAHPIHQRSQARIQPPFRRYAAVLADVFYDHFLARDWEIITSQTGRLHDFTRSVYASFAAHWDALDPRVAQGLRRMAADDWLGSYATLEGIDAILKRMTRRLSRPNLLGEALPQLVAHYDGLREDFYEFFPHLKSELGK